MIKKVKYLKLGFVVLAIYLSVCNHKNENSKLNAKQKQSSKSSVISDNKGISAEKHEIQILIRKTLNWSQSKNSFILLPLVTSGNDSVTTGFDLEELKKNLKKLKQTNYFSSEFIENYRQIILTLDKKLRNKEFEEWQKGELQTFSFANDVDPWCLCQDVPYDKPNPWDLITIQVITLDNEKGELYWKWGRPELNGSPDWKEFVYKFKVKKENDTWKISYLQGFDFKISTKKDGS